MSILKYLLIPFLIVFGYLAWWYHTWALNRRVEDVIKRTREEIDGLVKEHKATLDKVSQEHKAELEAAHKARIEQYEKAIKDIQDEQVKFKGVSKQRLAEYINGIKGK
jgi:C4-dicarboxylate-specific signal transduction histidine kinase